MNATTLPTFPIVREYKNEPGEHRNASISIFNDGDERYGEFRVVISHECWTGARWLPICQSDNAYSLERAYEIARHVRDSFGWVKKPARRRK